MYNGNLIAPLGLPILNNNTLAGFGDDFFLTLFPFELADNGLGDRDIITPALAGYCQFSNMFFCHGNIITKKYVLSVYVLLLIRESRLNVPGTMRGDILLPVPFSVPGTVIYYL